jgi:hypothetical protein
MYNNHPGSIANHRSTFVNLTKVTNPQKTVLTLIGAIPATKTNIRLVVQKDGTKLYPTEQRLEKNDKFYGLAVQIAVRTFKKDGDNLIPIGEEETHANPKWFKGKRGTLLECDSVRTVWDSMLSVENAKWARLPLHSTKQYMYVPSEHANGDNSRGYIYLDVPLLLSGDETDFVNFMLPGYAQSAITGDSIEETVVGTDKVEKVVTKTTDMVNMLVINILGYNAMDAVKAN